MFHVKHFRQKFARDETHLSATYRKLSRSAPDGAKLDGVRLRNQRRRLWGG